MSYYQPPVTDHQPLAVYVHWPFCKAKCPYCDFNSHVRDSVDHAAWREALLAELAHFAQRLPGRNVTSIFFGGGTPSLMPPGTAEAIIRAVHRHWRAKGNVEITLEANPTSVEASALKDFYAAGVNRVSLGVQAMNDADLHFLGRQHSAKEALQAVEMAAGIFLRYSFDLIYARPGQTAETWESELTQALKYADGHLSLYQLTIEENTAFHHAYHQQRAFTLPDEEHAARLYERTQEIMQAHNMPAYEISNHAKLGQESRHNLAYWRALEYVGIGPGAHGRINMEASRPTSLEPRPMRAPGGAQRGQLNTRIATVSTKSPERWLAQVQQQGHGISETMLSSQEMSEEAIMMGLRLREGIELAHFNALTGKPLQETIHQPVLSRLIREGLLELTSTHLRATAQGKLVLTTITGELLK